jgi:nicotinate phosphoribosyltransferase
VGTSISNAPVVDFAMDIMEIEGKPRAKRGKWSGAKDVLRCKECGARKIIPLGADTDICSCGSRFGSLFAPLIKEGKVSRKLPAAKEIREYALKRTEGLEL